MKRINRTALISWGILLAGLAGALVCLPSLPDQIPIHWNAAGEIDGWGSPGIGVLAAAGRTGV